MKRRFALAALVAALAGCPAGPATPGAPGVATPKVAPAFSVGVRPLGIVAANGDIYCACEGGSAIEVFDIAKRQVIKHMPLDPGGTPGVIRTFIDRRQVVVQDTVNGKLRVIDAGTAALTPGLKHETPPPVATQVLHTLDVGKGAGALAFGDDDSTVLSSAGNDNKLVLFTFQNERTIAPARAEIPVGPPAADGSARPIDLKGGTILTADMTTNQIETLPMGGGTPHPLATVGKVGPLAFGLVNGMPKLALALDTAKDALVIVDVASGKASTVTDIGKGARDMALDPETGRAFLAMHDSNEVAVVDYVNGNVLYRLPTVTGPTTISMAPPLPGEVWVGGDKGTLAVLDGNADKPTVKATFTLGAGDHRLTFFGTDGFISNADDGTLSIVDRETIAP